MRQIFPGRVVCELISFELADFLRVFLCKQTQILNQPVFESGFSRDLQNLPQFCRLLTQKAPQTLSLVFCAPALVKVQVIE